MCIRDSQKRVSIPHRMVRRVAGYADARGICDSDGSQPSQEPAQSAVVDQRVGHRDCRDCAAVHAVGEGIAVCTTARIVVGGDCVSCGDLSLCRAGCEVVVLSSARVALIVLVEEGTGPGLLPIIRTHATVPNSHPMPEVIAMASAPQKVTRIAPVITLAPPACAASPPRSARKSSEVPDTRSYRQSMSSAGSNLRSRNRLPSS